MQRISRSRRRSRSILAAVLGSSLCAGAARAADLYWDNNGTTGGVGGGPGNWLDASRWSTTLTGNDAASWIADSTAIFAGTASAVTVNGPVGAAGLTFSTNNYTFAGGNTLTLSGLTPTIKLNDTNIAGGFTSVGNAPISAANEVLVTKGTGTGIHQLTLNNTGNTFSGGIRVPSVTGNIRFNIQSTGSLGSGAGAGTITVQGANTVFTTLTSGPAGTVTVANPFVLSSGIDVGFNATGGSTTLDFTGQISGAGNVIVDSAPTNNGPDGGGITVFSNASNSFSSLVICNVAATGVVRLGAQGALPTGASLTFGRGLATVGNDVGLLDLASTNISIASLATNVGGSGNTVKGITNSNNSAGGSISITGSSTTTYASTIGAGANNTNMTSATDNLSLTLTSGHSGSLTLSGNNTYTGNTTVEGGTLNIANTTGNGLASPVIVSGGTINVQNSGGNGIANNVTVSSGTMTLRNTAGVGLLGNASVTGGTLNAGATASGTFMTGNVTVSGTGTLGSAAGTRLGTVATISGDVTVNSGGNVAPAGTGVGTLKPTNLIVNNSGKLTFSLSSVTEYDLIDLASGALTLDTGGTHTIDITGTPTAGNSYTLLTYGSRIWDTTNAFSLGSTPGGFNYSLTQTGDAMNAGSVILNVTAITPNLVWDVGGLGLPITDGDGVWTDGSGNFYDTTGATAANFANINNHDVTFGNSAGNNGGVVTFSGNIRVGGKLILGPISGTPFYQLGLVGSSETLTTSANGILASSSADIEAPVTLEASQTWTTSAGATLTVSGAISGSGMTLTTAGDGTLLVSSNAANIGTLDTTLGTTTLSGSNHVIGTLSVTGATTSLSGGGHNISAVNVSAGTLTLAGSGNTLGAISVSGGSATISGSTNTVTSAAIGGGSLIVSTDSALGSAPISISNNATLRTNASVNLSNAISIASTGGTASVDTAFTSTFGGNVTGAGALTKSGAGTLVLTGTNTMNGLSISNGIVVAGSDSNLGSGGLSIGNAATLRASASFSSAKTITQIGGTSSRFDIPTGLTVLLSGNISGTIALSKEGAGTLVLSGSNSGMSGQIQFAAGAGGVIETLSSNALGSGALFPFSNGTLRTTNDLTLNVVRGGTAAPNFIVTKEGAGKLTVTGTTNSSNFNDGTAIVVDAGSVQMDSHTGLGGFNTAPTTTNQMPITMNSGTELIVNWATTTEPRYSRNINLNDATVTRVNGAGSGALGLAEFSTHATTAASKNGVLGITGSALIRNQETSGATLKHLQFQMPVNIAAAATLTLSSANNTGDYHNTRVVLRGPQTAANMPSDALTLEAGATLVASGSGEKSIGGPGSNLNQGNGLPIVGKGTPGNESTLRLDSHTLLTDRNAAGGSPSSITKLLVTGSGSAGLRVEAPMNATYTVPNPGGAPANRTYDGTTGLFGMNSTTTFDTTAIPPGYSAIGNNYTVMSPKRVNQLSDTFIGSISAPVTLGGTLTLAATDSTTPAAGTLATGPNLPASIRLALDNAAASAGANLVYQIDGAADSAKFSNFAGLDVKRSNSGAGGVKAKLVSNTSTPSVSVSGGAQLDVDNRKLVLTDMSEGTWNGTAYDGVLGMVRAGRGGAGVASWNGSGIMTSQTHAIGPSYITSLAVATADEIDKIGQAWGGYTLATGDVLVSYTYGGDANLSGSIDGDDFAQIDAGYSASSTGYFNGDFNYSGNIDADDYFIIDANYGRQTLGSFSSGAPVAGVTSVPEPACFALPAIVSYLCTRRRRCC